MFRDPRIAHREKELAELRAERDRLRDENEDLREDLEEEQTKEKRASWFQNWLEHRRVMKAERAERRLFRGRRRFSMSPFTFHKGLVTLIFLGFIGVLGTSIYHYATDPVEGTVYAREYHPPSVQCSSDGNGGTTCTTIPESWTVSIGDEDGRTGTWTVSEREYNRANRGSWFCYTDLLHPASDCQGPPR